MDSVIYQRAALRQHLGIDSKSEGQDAVQTLSHSAKPSPASFFVERCPPSDKPARCALICCSRLFVSGRHRIAVTPAISRGAPQNADLYHVSCFEKIADLSNLTFLNYLEPFTQFTDFSRPNAEYICSGGVERLIFEWKSRRQRWSKIKRAKNESNEDDAKRESDNGNSMNKIKMDEDVDGEIISYNVQYDQSSGKLFKDLWYNAGSSRYESYGLIPGMQRHQYFLLLNSLAPWESDGPADTEEWNLFDTFLGKEEFEGSGMQGKEVECISLSTILEEWEKYEGLVLSQDSTLSQDQLKEKAKIGPKGCRAIKRLAVIPVRQSLWQF